MIFLSQSYGRFCRSLLTIIIAAGSLLATQSAQAGNFQIFPGRLIFGPGGGVQIVTVLNSEKAAADFEMSIDDYVMTPAGEIVPLGSIADNSDLKPVAARIRSAKSLLMVGPRRMTIAALAGQQLRIRANPGQLAPGEYRSHLQIKSLPLRTSAVSSPDNAGTASGLQMQFQFALQMTIPLIVRVGPRDARAELLHPQMKQITLPATADKPEQMAAALQLDVARRGASSVFGNVEVRVAGANPKEPPLGELKWLGVYPEIESRPATVMLKRTPQSGERLVVTYWDQEKVARKPLAQIEYQVP
jgi:P pilus assembly chaperone PapD